MPILLMAPAWFAFGSMTASRNRQRTRRDQPRRHGRTCRLARPRLRPLARCPDTAAPGQRRSWLGIFGVPPAKTPWFTGENTPSWRTGGATPMTIEERLAPLEHMTTAEWKTEWRLVFGEDPRSGNRAWMQKRLAWALQAEEYGGLSEEAQRRIEELLPEALKWLPWGIGAFPMRDAAGSPVRRRDLAPGTTLTRRYKDRTIVVRVRGDGRFEYEGRLFSSLTAVVKEVTGGHWSGNHFFKLPKVRKGDAASA